MKNLKTIIYSVSALAIIAPSIASSVALAQNVDNEDVIIVTANRSKLKLKDTGLSVSVIDAQQIKASQQSAIADLVRSLPGVSMTRTGGYGATTSIRIRGTESQHVVLLLDGIKLSDPSSPQGNLDIGNLMIGNIDRVELLRGSQSVVWGSQAIGGVLQMFTTDPTDQTHYNLKAEAGSMATQNYTANISKRIGKVGMIFGISYFDTNGFSAFNEFRRAPNPGFTDDDGYRNVAVNGKVIFNVTDNVTLNLFGYHADSSLRYDNTTSDADYRQDGEITLRDIGLKSVNYGGKLISNLHYSQTKSERDYSYGDYIGDSHRLSYVGEFTPREDFGVVFGAEKEDIKYNISGSRKNVSQNSYFVQANAKPISALSISAGIRDDDHEVYGENLIFDINGAYKLFGDNTIIRASFGQGFRAPSLYELYSPYGNTALKPESADSYDFGLSQKIGTNLSFSATGFNIDSTDLIAFASSGYVNVSKASSKGYELVLDYVPLKNLSLSANYTYDKAINTISKLRLPRRPQDNFNFNTTYTWNNGLKTGVRVTYAGDSFDDTANKTRVKAYAIGDILLSYPLGKNTEIYGRVENVTDKKYETIYRYGTQRRSYFAGIRYSF